MGLIFAILLWKMKLTTIADFFRHRYSTGTERITALIMVPTSLLWAVAQIRAFGQVLPASSEPEITLAIAIAALVVILYTAMGGLLADAITDIIQGGILIIGLFILLFSVPGDLGGIGAALQLIVPDKLSVIPTGSVSGYHKTLSVIEAWAIPKCGSVVAQEVISRVLASRSPQVARRPSFMASWLYLCIGIIPLFISLIGFTIIPNLADPKHVLPLMAQKHLSGFFFIIFAGALVSAILSTVDSALLAASALLTHNLVVSIKPGMSESYKLRANRIGVILMGLVVYLRALNAEGIYNLVKEVSSFGSAGIFIVLIFGLFTRFGGVKSAIFMLTIGSIVWFYSHYILHFEWSYVLSLTIALLGYLIVALFEVGLSKSSGLQKAWQAIRVSGLVNRIWSLF
jgi:Na+/proline symporter